MLRKLQDEKLGVNHREVEALGVKDSVTKFMANIDVLRKATGDAPR